MGLFLHFCKNYSVLLHNYAVEFAVLCVFVVLFVAHRVMCACVVYFQSIVPIFICGLWKVAYTSVWFVCLASMGSWLLSLYPLSSLPTLISVVSIVCLLLESSLMCLSKLSICTLALCKCIVFQGFQGMLFSVIHSVCNTVKTRLTKLTNYSWIK